MPSTHQHSESAGHRDWSRINQWLLWLGLAAAVALLYFGHGAHMLQLAPFLILLACPLMHVFGHSGHGGHAHRRPNDAADHDEPPAPPGAGGGHVH